MRAMERSSRETERLAGTPMLLLIMQNFQGKRQRIVTARDSAGRVKETRYSAGSGCRRAARENGASQSLTAPFARPYNLRAAVGTAAPSASAPLPATEIHPGGTVHVAQVCGG